MLGYLIDVYGITVCQPSPAQALNIIAQQISDRDNSVRVAALNVIASAYSILGETVYNYIGNVSVNEPVYLFVFLLGVLFVLPRLFSLCAVQLW